MVSGTRGLKIDKRLPRIPKAITRELEQFNGKLFVRQSSAPAAVQPCRPKYPAREAPPQQPRLRDAEQPAECFLQPLEAHETNIGM